jgi:hypothetical protein
MTSCIDFIDSPAIRDHLRTLPPLPPAQQCILISQSAIRPLKDKLAALREIRAATPPEEFSRGCWRYQCNDTFHVILDRYLRTWAERLAALREPGHGIVYIVEWNDRYHTYGGPFSTFGAALASIRPIEDDEFPPSIRRCRIDEPDGATLVAALSRKLEVIDIDLEGDSHHNELEDLPHGYAHVPHPFKRGDIIRQGDSYYVLDESEESTDGRFSWGVDDSDMQLYGMSWDRPTGTFGHEHIFYTRGGTELVAPSDLPEEERMLAAVSEVMRDGHALIEFLQCFTCGDRETLERDAVKGNESDKPFQKSSCPKLILRSDSPGLPANVWLYTRKYFGVQTYFRVQRDGAAEPHYWDTVEVTLEAEPRFLGGTGDLAPEDVQTIRNFIVRNLDPLLAYWNAEMSFNELRAKLQESAFQGEQP